MNNQKLFDSLITYCEPPYIFAKLNCCWLLFNAPVVWLALQLYFSTNASQFIWTAIFLICLMPIIFFPSTIALFGMIRRWEMKGESEQIFSHFISFYKENFKQAIQGGMIYSIIMFITANIFWPVLLNGNKIVLFALIGSFLFILGWLFNFCCDIIQYRISTAKAILKTLFITLTYWYMTFISGFFMIIGVYILFKLHLFFILFFSGSLICSLFWKSYQWSMNRAMKKVKQNHNT